jgi:phosphoadenosine phosphosulfate reductase
LRKVENVLGQLNFESKDKIEIAIERIRTFYREPYYVGISGGKDSDVIYKLMQLSGVKFDIHHQHTTIDAPQTIRYLRDKFTGINIDYPQKSIWKLIVENGTPPTRLMRYCCRELKEYGGEGRFKVLGVRWSESSKRKNNRRLIETCIKQDTRTLNPIIDWTDSDVWEFHRIYNLSHNPLYDIGYCRVGCIMCPQKGKKAMLEDAKRFPAYYKQYIRTFKKMLEVRQAKGLETTWKTSEDVMNWWLDICK